MNFEREIKLLQLQVSDILRKIKAKSTSWGQLLGDIRNQKDLMRYFGLKQDLLKSGKNIKTINGSSLLGSGDLTVTGGAGAVEKRHEWGSPYSYCGVAPDGTLDSASTWEIKRIEVLLDGTTNIMSASLVSWNDRLTVIYI